MREQLQAARAQCQDHARTVVADERTQLREPLLQVEALLDVLRGNRLPYVATTPAGAVQNEAVGRNRPASAQEADVHAAIGPLLREQARQDRHPDVGGRRIEYGSVVW